MCVFVLYIINYSFNELRALQDEELHLASYQAVHCNKQTTVWATKTATQKLIKQEVEVVCWHTVVVLLHQLLLLAL